jgi:hypothetical protein
LHTAIGAYCSFLQEVSGLMTEGLAEVLFEAHQVQRNDCQVLSLCISLCVFGLPRMDHDRVWSAGFSVGLDLGQAHSGSVGFSLFKSNLYIYANVIYRSNFRQQSGAPIT